MMDNVSVLPGETVTIERDKKWNNGGQIRQFYSGKKILLTGSTGFLGRGIVDKLLRTCVEIDKIYLLIRTKRNMTTKQRMEKYFDDPVFETLQKMNPNFAVKVQAIYGDLQKNNLDLSPEDYTLLTKNVDIIIHNGADVSFFARMSSILRTNSLSTKYLLDLAINCTNLKAFVYVLIVYSHSYNSRIKNKFYPPPGDINMIEDLIRADESTENGFNNFTLRRILGKWFNTYTFSKAFAESFVEEFSRKTSAVCAVFRPSIVVSSYKEPVPGWIGSKSLIAGVVITYGLGLVHATPMRDDTIIDFVPVDMTVNSLLAKSEGPQVYNYGSSFWKPFYDKVYHLTSFERIQEYPFNNMYWYPFMILTRNYYICTLLNTLLLIIPSAVHDFGHWILGKKAQGLAVALKISQFTDSLYYFLTNNWIVEVENTQNILVRMNEADHKEFPFDLGKVDWWQCMRDFTLGIKVHLLKESKDSIPTAKKRFRNFAIVHYAAYSCILLLVVYLWFKIMSTVLFNDV